MRSIIFICCFAISFLCLSACQKKEPNDLPKIEWETIMEFSGKDIVGLSIDPEENTIYIVYNIDLSDEIALFKSTDVTNWEMLNASIYYPEDGYSSSQFGNISGLGVYDGRIFIGTSMADIFVKAPQDTAFSHVLRNFGDDIVQFTFMEDQVFASGLGSGLYHSEDNGLSWEKVLDNQVNFENHVEVTSAAFNSAEQLFVGTTNFWGDITDQSYILSSMSPFNEWRIMRSGANAEDYINCLFIDSKNNILAGTEYGGILYSFDNGENWTEPDTSFFKTVTDLEINGEGHLFASVFKRPSNETNSSTFSIYRSSHINSDWNSIEFDNFGRINEMIMTNDGALYVATRNGLYKTVESTVLKNR